MSEPKADKASDESLAKTEGRVAERPVGMLIRLSSQPEIDESTRELILDLAEQLFPGVQHLDQLPPTKRRVWIVIQAQLIQDANPEARQSIEVALQRFIDKEVEITISEVVDKAERVEVELAISEVVDKAEQAEEKLPESEEGQLVAVRRWVPLRAAEPAWVRHPILPPPPSPRYDRPFGNQIRWAIHVIRYALQQRRLKSSFPETE
jgi:hypothetical protein